MKLSLLRCIALLLGFLLTTSGHSAPIAADHIQVDLVSDVTSVKAGEPFWAGILLTPDEHWHTYWKNPGDSGLATSADWTLPKGTTISEFYWPIPEQIKLDPLVNYGYEGPVLLPVKITPSETMKSGDSFTMIADTAWLVCKESCIPGNAKLGLTLNVTNNPPAVSRYQSLFKETLAKLPRETKGWSSEFAIVNEEFKLTASLDSDLFKDAARLEFFPVNIELIEYGSPQTLTFDASGFTVSQQQSLFFNEAPDLVEALVVKFDQQGGRQGFLFSATQGQYPFDGQAVGTATSASSFSGGLTESSAIALESQLAQEQANLTIPIVLLLALLGGVILNLMPCVFPVLSIKVLSLTSTTDLSAKVQRLHGIAYALGIILAFIAVASVLIILKAGGASIGWGFQLQSPWFVAILAYLFFAMGLSLSGVIDLGQNLMGVGQKLTESNKLSGSFFTGVLATIVASPCTAPFMGTALGFAVTQPPFIALSVFAFLGLGMALPFLALSFIPQFARFLPKPGPWMESFKQLMAFPLYATVVWLVWVIGRQTDPTGMAFVLTGLVLIAFALWLWGRSKQTQALWPKIQLGSSIAIIALAFAMLQNPLLVPSYKVDTSDELKWEPFSEERLQALKQAQRPILVNMTADWCITCLANERVAFNSDAVKKAFSERNVAYLKGDWTNKDSEITKVLERYGRSGVPLYIFYPPNDQDPLILPQLLTPNVVLSALDEVLNSPRS